jgi:hypothetical protein
LQLSRSAAAQGTLDRIPAHGSKQLEWQHIVEDLMDLSEVEAVDADTLSTPTTFFCRVEVEFLFSGLAVTYEFPW